MYLFYFFIFFVLPGSEVANYINAGNEKELLSFIVFLFHFVYFFCILTGSEVANYMFARKGGSPTRGSQFCEPIAERLLSIQEFDLKLGPSENVAT